MDAMRTATAGVVNALSGVHESLAARGMSTDRFKVVELTTAIVQLIQLQEGINHKLFKGLLQVTLANDKVDRRIASLEHIFDENSIPPSKSPERQRPPSPSFARSRSHSPKACSSSPKCTSQSPGTQFSQATKKDLNGLCKNRKRINVASVKPVDTTSPNQTKMKSVPERNINAVSTGNHAVTEDSTGIVNKRDGMGTTTPRPIKRQRLCNPAEVRRESKTQVISAPILACEGTGAQTRRTKFPSAMVLPALPTLRDVEAEIEDSERRQRTSRKPQNPACDKCRVRKRADMLRQRGYIDEDVFDRWAARPGGCLGYVHMDEPGAPPSPLSFPETPTCSPPEAN